MNDTANRQAGGLPTVPFGGHRLSRLILGANPINGGSHLSRFVNNRMKEYFTEERVLDLLRTCEKAGITAWQSGPVNLGLYRRHRETGGSLLYISLAHGKDEEQDGLQRLAEAGTIAVAHHGEVTDSLYKSGKLASVRGFLGRVRDRGMMAGISTHMPAVVERVEDEGWDVDFYMTCVYERHRTREELSRMLGGHVPLPIPEVYLEDDPPRMWAVMRRTARPCLAFKILAAGRLCDRRDTVEEAFKSTLENIKPRDAVIVGMYPEYEDQVAMNAGFVRAYSRTDRSPA